MVDQTTADIPDEEEFNKRLDKELTKYDNELKDSINIAVIGSVSVGKSSFLNAFFEVKKDGEHHFKVGAESGVTTESKIISYGKDVNIIDLPGLDDVKNENSQESINFLEHIDIGILIIIGSADATQKQNYDKLRKHCDEVFVVLNKVDEYDKRPKALDKVIEQWKEVLGLETDAKIWQTCCDGYDPDYEAEEMDIRGIKELRETILETALKEGKALKLRRVIEGKTSAAKQAVIYGVIAAAVAALIPGPSAVYIVTAQVLAITRLHYIHTDEIISKKAVLAIIPVFVGQSVVSSIFFAVLSFMPPTGILELAGAITAIIITSAMLVTVNWLYTEDYTLDDKEMVKKKYNEFYAKIKNSGLESSIKNNANTKDAVKQVFKGNKEPLRKLLNDILQKFFDKFI